jgi:heterodisulfide reductase subunit B
LSYQAGSVNVRHLLDIIVNDAGYEAIAAAVSKPLYGLKIAPYYGCLIVRPGFHGRFDDTEYPTSMDRLLQVLGAEVVDYPVKAQCCGGHMPQISERIALSLLYKLLKCAADNEADMLVTLCPMCQLNVDAYQDAVNKHYGTDFHIPVLYFTQMMGLAFGMSAAEMGIGSELVDARPALAKVLPESPPQPRQKRPSKHALPMPEPLEAAF